MSDKPQNDALPTGDNGTKPAEKDLSEIQNAEEVPAQQPSLTSPSGRELSIDEMLARQAQRMQKPGLGFPGSRAPVETKKKNTKQLVWGGVGVVCLILIMTFYALQPNKGSMAFGICSTFLELNIFYPHTLNITDIEGSRTAVRIYFTNVDPFGEFQQEMIECTFGPDEVMGMKLTQVSRNRRRVDPSVVNKFNLTLPTIMSSEPNLILPPDWKNPLIPD